MPAIEYNRSNLDQVRGYAAKQFKEEDVVIVNFGRIGAMVIDGLSEKANQKVIELKSMGNRSRRGPLSSFLSVDDAVKFELIDFERLISALKLKKGSAKSQRNEAADYLKRFDGLAFKRIPLNVDTANILPRYLIEYTNTGPSIQIFSFLGEPGELIEILQAEMIKTRKQFQDSIPILGVTSLNFSGEKSAITEKDIETVTKKMGHPDYLAVKDRNSYRTGSFPIIDFTQSEKRGVVLVREGNLDYHILKILYPKLKNGRLGYVENILSQFKLNPMTKDIINLVKSAYERFQTDTKITNPYFELRNYLVKILQDVVITDPEQ